MNSAALSDNTPIHPDDELLVAYLDGELSRADQTAVENRLVDDERLRSRLQQLQTGWDLLDDLPEPSTSMKLVESTLELVVADLVKKPQESQSAWKRYRLPISILGVCLAGVLGAFLLIYLQRAGEYRQQLRELAIAENVDAYNHGSNLELMRLLSANPEWLKMKNTLEEMGDIEIKSIAGLAAVPVEEREAFIKELPPTKINQLNTRWERFNRLDDGNQRRIRRTAEAVAQAPDSELLLETMQAYDIWRQSLPTDLRDAIESSDPKERRDAVQAAIENTQVSISRASSLKLDDETIDIIYITLQQIARDRGDTMPIPESIENSPDREWWMIARMVMNERGRGGSGRGSRPTGGPGSPGGPGGPPGFTRAAPLNSDELNMFLYFLPESAMDDLELVAGGDPLLESMTLKVWAEEAVKRKSPFDRTKLSLLERYENLDENDRNRIDLLPPEEFLRELSRGGGRPRFGSP